MKNQINEYTNIQFSHCTVIKVTNARRPLLAATGGPPHAQLPVQLIAPTA
jgi:hypothetical protein